MMLSGPVPAPDPSTCGGYWSPIVAAGPQSSLSGVLAGFVFTAITVVLTTSLARGRHVGVQQRWRPYALQLFFSAFIVLALDGYFTSITSGELACNRAYAESALSGGILGDGALLMIAGLCCLVVAYSIPGKGIEEILLYVNRGVWGVVVIMLTISSVDVGDAMLPGQSHIALNVLLVVVGVVMAALVVMTERLSIRLSNADTGKWVRYAALSGLAAAILGGLFTGIASAFGATWWMGPPTIAVYAVTLLAMLVPALPMLVSIPVATAARYQVLCQGDDIAQKSAPAKREHRAPSEKADGKL